MALQTWSLELHHDSGTQKNHPSLATKKHIFYWLFNRNPYNGLLLSPYNWAVFHPLYTLNNQVLFHRSVTTKRTLLTLVTFVERRNWTFISATSKMDVPWLSGVKFIESSYTNACARHLLDLKPHITYTGFNKYWTIHTWFTHVNKTNTSHYYSESTCVFGKYPHHPPSNPLWTFHDLEICSVARSPRLWAWKISNGFKVLKFQKLMVPPNHPF